MSHTSSSDWKTLSFVCLGEEGCSPVVLVLDSTQLAISIVDTFRKYTATIPTS